MLFDHGAVLGVLLEGCVDAVEQFLIAERFLQEVEGAVFHGLHRHGDVAVAGDQNDGDQRAGAIQVLLDFEAAHLGHAHIEHETAVLIGIELGEELARPCKCNGVVAHRGHQHAQRTAHALVVIDEIDHRFAFRFLARWIRHVRVLSAATGSVNQKQAPPPCASSAPIEPW